MPCPECPRCCYHETIRYGVTKGFAQRYKCKSCERTFSPDGKKTPLSWTRICGILAALKNTSIRKTAKCRNVSVNSIRKRKREQEESDAMIAKASRSFL